MIRISRSLRVGLAGAAAVATIAAGATALFVTPAQADATSSIAITPTQQTAAAGTCMQYVVTARDAFGRAATDTGTIDITLKENPESATQDVDFCVPTGATNYSTFSEFPNYVNVGVPRTDPNNCPPNPDTGDTGCRQFYAPGPSITTTASDSPGSPPAGQTDNPDSAANTSSQTGGIPPTGGNPNNNSNFTGTDRAAFQYGAGTANPGNVITFGVVGLIPGAATINATQRELKKNAAQATATFTTGGRPGVEAANAARTITVVPSNSVKPSSAPTHMFTLTVRNATGETLLGVTPSYVVTSGPGTNSTPRDCPATDNSGITTCTYTATAAGVDTLVFFVNQTTGTPTAGPDSSEPSTTATATTTPPAVAAQFAYSIDLTPDQATTPANGSRTFTAIVTASSGAPAQGVALTFLETGPGVFRGTVDSNGSSVVTGTTDSTGRVSVIVDVPSGVTGTETITASIDNPSTTQCQSAGGRCVDTSTNTISGSVSPSPTPSSSASPTSSPSATPSSSASISPTASPTATPRRALTLSVDTPVIDAGQTARLTATGAVNQQYELQCYTRPSSTYVTARSGAFDASGAPVTFTLSLGRNTRCFIQYATNAGQGASGSVVVNVRTVLSLSTVRQATRTYLFQGRNLPRVAGQLITLYRVDNAGNEIRTSNLVTDDSGIYRVTRKFTGTGTFRFKVRTSQTLNNAAGVSNTITVRVF